MAQGKKADIKNLHEALFSYINDAVFIYQRPDGTSPTSFIEVNDAACKMLGFSKNELLSMSHKDLSDLNDEDIIKYSDDQHILFESVMRTKDNHYIPVEISSHIFVLDGIQTVIAAIRDISERKKVEDAKTESEEQYKALFHNINEAVYVSFRSGKDVPKQFVDVNDVACHMLGYSREEFLKMGPMDIADPHSKLDFDLLGKELSENGHVLFETIHVAKDGRKIQVEESTHMFDFKGVRTSFSIVRDISEQKKAIEEKEEQEERYRALFNNINEAVYVTLRSSTREARNFVDVNDVACRMMGYTREEFLKIGPEAISDPDNVTDRTSLTKQLLEKKHVLFESVHVAKNGKKIPVELSVHMFDVKGATTSVSVVKDITERKKIELEKKQSRQVLERSVAERTDEWKQANAQLKKEITERKQVENELLRLSSAMEQASDGIAIANTNGIIQYTNNAHANMHGYSQKELLGSHLGSLNKKVISKQYQGLAIDTLVNQSDMPSLEVEHARKDGSTFPALVSLSYLKDENGKNTGMVTIVRDITERKLVENELLRLNSAVQQASDGVIIFNITEKKILYVNNTFARMIGYEPQELIGSRFQHLIHRLLSDKYNTLSDVLTYDTLAEIQEAGDTSTRTVEIEHIRKNGSVFPAMLSFAYLENEGDQTSDLVVVIKDITERKSAEAEIHRLNSAMEQASDGIAIFSKDTRVISYINAAYAEMLGYSPDELIGTGFRSLNNMLISSQFKTLGDVLDVTTGAVQTLEIEHIRKDGSMFPILGSFTFVKNDDGEITEVVVQAKDITERRRAEAEIRRLNSAMEQASDGIVIFNSNDREISYVNNAFNQMLGYAPQELIGSQLRHLVNKLLNSEDKTLSDILNVTGDVTQTVEIEHVRKNGSFFPALASFAYIKNESGQTTDVVAVIKDITESKRAQSEILQLNSAMRQASDGIAIFNKSTGHISYINNSYEQMLGYEPHELIDAHIRNLMNRTVDDKYRSLADILDDEIPAEQNVPVEHIRKDGSVFPAIMSLAYIFDDDGEITGDVLIVTRDVTESKKTEAELLKLNSAMKQASDGIAIFSRSDKKISYVNNAYAVMLGYSAQELMGLEFRYVLHQLVDSEYDSLSDVLDKHILTNPVVEVEHRRKDGSVFPAILSTAYIMDETEEPTDTIVVVASDITNRKKAERELLRLNSAMEQASDGIAVFNQLTGTISYANNAFSKALDYTKQEIEGLHIRQTLNRVISNKFATLGELLELRETNTQTIEVEHLRKDGSIFPALQSIAYIKDDSNEADPTVIVVSRDITERKQAEKAIKESEEKYRASFDKARDAINVFTPGRTFVDANKKFLELCGYSKNELLKLHLFDVYPEASSEESQERVIAATQGKEVPVFEVDLIRKDGTSVPVEIAFSAIKNAYGHDIVFQGNIRDITERKEMELQLKHNYDLQNVLNALLSLSLSDVSLSTLLKKSIDMLLKIPWFASQSTGSIFLADDHNNLVLRAQIGLGNKIQKLCKTVPFGWCLCGRAASSKKVVFADCIDKSHKVVFNGIEPHGHYCVPILSFGKTLGVINVYTAEGHTYDGKEVQFLQSMASVLAGIIVRKRAEEEVKQSNAELEKANVELKEADKLKSIFLASMSHELRTPLNSIIGFTTLMQQGMTGAINNEQKSQLGIVKGSANHLLSLINDVLDLSKLEAGRVDLIVEKFNLYDLLSESLGTFAPMVKVKNIQLNSDYPSDLTLCNDPRRLKQIIINLVSNAVKFTDKGNVNVLATTQNGNLMIQVKDTGMGMMDADMRRLFQPFQQLNEQLVKSREGTGLGLYLSRKLANLMGGDISAVSEFGVGSIFTVTTPIDVGNRKESTNE